ncbi:hypothetical protein [Halopiger thermotolerans]
MTLWTVTYAWDRFTDREPLIISLGLSVGLFSFIMLWQFYAAAGAVGTVVGTLIATAGLIRFRHYATRPAFWVAAFGVYAMWDDWASHALGVPTPLDWLFEAYVHGLIS